MNALGLASVAVIASLAAFSLLVFALACKCAQILAEQRVVEIKLHRLLERQRELEAWAEDLWERAFRKGVVAAARENVLVEPWEEWFEKSLWQADLLDQCFRLHEEGSP